MGQDKHAESPRSDIKKLLTILPLLRQHRNNIDELDKLIQQHELGSLIRNDFKSIDEIPSSLTRSHNLTHALITHTEQAFETWRKNNGDTHDHRRMRRILIAYYNLGFDTMRKTIHELAIQERVTEEKIKKELACACRELSILVFGVNGAFKYIKEQNGKNPFLGKPSAPGSQA